jgi:hypothetical protein
MTAYCTLDDLRQFSGINSEDAEQQLYINAAADIINSYIGYDIHKSSREDYVNGTGKKILFVKSSNVTEITQVKIDDTEITDTFKIIGSMIVTKNTTFPIGIKNVYIKYTAGFEDTDIPYIFKLVNIEIAALIESLSGGNIGITSKSFDASGTRTFLQNVNYDKYLQNLSCYKLV